MTYDELVKLDKVLNLLELSAVEILQNRDSEVDSDYLDELNKKAMDIIDTMVPRPLPTRLEFNEEKHPTNTA